MKKYAFVLAAGLLVACGDETPQTPSQQAIQKYVGRGLAGASVTDLDGQAQPLNDPFVLNGKPVVINVWATWCTPCLKEMPTLDALGKQGRYTVLAIATDKDAATVKAFLKKQNWGSGLTVLHDRLGAVTREAMGAVNLPVTLVTDPSLTVKLAEAGERDWAHPKMQAKIVEALGK